MLVNGTAWETPYAKLNLLRISNQCYCSFYIILTLFSIHDQTDVKLLTRLRLKFNHLSNLKFRHKFKDCLRPRCNCVTEFETTKHHFLAMSILGSERHNLHDNLCLIDSPVICFDRESLLNVLLYCSDEFNDKIKIEILLPIIRNRPAPRILPFLEFCPAHKYP